jgi:transcriptional regulator with XRE-family HTH domain
LNGWQPAYGDSGPLDAMVGTRISSILRVCHGMSRATLAERIGVTFQEVQKYERGAIRVGASRLSQIASVPGVSVASCSNLPQPDRPA